MGLLTQIESPVGTPNDTLSFPVGSTIRLAVGSDDITPVNKASITVRYSNVNAAPYLNTESPEFSKYFLTLGKAVVSGGLTDLSMSQVCFFDIPLPSIVTNGKITLVVQKWSGEERIEIPIGVGRVGKNPEIAPETQNGITSFFKKLVQSFSLLGSGVKWIVVIAVILAILIMIYYAWLATRG